MKKKNQIGNPFSVTSYLGKEYFCDRENETQALHNALSNNRNITLISPRKIGKTGIIRHLFDSIPPQEATCIYVDIYKTGCLADFTQTFAEAILTHQITPFSTRIWKKITQVFSSLRPTFSIDSITGTPQCRVDIQPQNEEATLQQLFEYLENANLPCYVAFDEFQVIADYDGCQMEAVLRSYIQYLHNTHFIFAGSKKHTMVQLFSSANRPFYQSTQIMMVGEIDETKYAQFAQTHLEKHGQTMTNDAFHVLYSLVHGHTWYVQTLLNRLYQDGTSNITPETVNKILQTILIENEPVYQTYCQLLTQRQNDVLRAIAAEGYVKELGNIKFLQKYKLGANSTVRSAVQALTDKELLLENNGNYCVYDRFFGLWLANY